jgi:membrane complex biogenesis BtpA family protein
MHDIPYIKSSKFGPEVVASMTAVTSEIQKVLRKSKKKIPIGIQVLACGGKEALAIAKSTGCDFIRNEGFVFSHIGDEGFIDSNAGELLRYRKSIDAEDVLIFSDIKKKHSSHAITSDVTLLETAFAAQFFRADGIILTGKSTGDSTDLDELKLIDEQRNKLNLPVLIGSGVTKENLRDYVGLADALIIGSHFKRDGHWSNELCGERVGDFMAYFDEILK